MFRGRCVFQSISKVFQWNVALSCRHARETSFLYNQSRKQWYHAVTLHQPTGKMPQFRYFSLTETTDSLVDLVVTTKNGKSCQVHWRDGFQAEFHSIWLSHCCHCTHCRFDSGQIVLDAASLDINFIIENACVKDNNLEIVWKKGISEHKGYIPLTFLRKNNYETETILARRSAVKCDKPVTEVPTMEYEEIFSEKGILKWLQQINIAGLNIVRGVPTDEFKIVEVAEKIGPITNTMYGTTFDVRVEPDPINVAYSSVHLDLHMDLVYLESPPGLQLFHCLSFDESIMGGESIFIDCFAQAEEFRCNFPDLFDVLCTVPATFQKVHYSRDHPVHIVNQKPHIKLNHFGEVVGVFWAPAFEGALSVPSEYVDKYYTAYQAFAKQLKNSPNLLTYRLQPGDLLVVNNRRMLHGRTEFQLNGGTRHLKGCYLDIDTFKSQTQVYNNLIGDGRLAKRVGNQCYF